MTMPEITEEMVTAAARVYARSIGDDYDEPDVGDAERAQADYRIGATKVVEAVWPHIEAVVRAKVAGEIRLLVSNAADEPDVLLGLLGAEMIATQGSDAPDEALEAEIVRLLAAPSYAPLNGASPTIARGDSGE